MVNELRVAAQTNPLMTAKSIDPARITRVEDLNGLSSVQLTELFADGRAPNPAQFTGEMKGLALSVPFHEGDVLDKASPVLGPYFWEGKTVLSQPTPGQEGTGTNRIVSDAIKLFPFQWKLTPSDRVINDAKAAGDIWRTRTTAQAPAPR